MVQTNWSGRKIEHCKNFDEKDKSCGVAIPVYKDRLTNIEKASLRQCVDILGNKYDIVLVCPDKLNITEYEESCEEYDFSVLYCDNSYFRGQKSYSDLCETLEWYECFNEYQYMLIYQLDAWIFEDRLDYFIGLEYDYIGGPHLVSDKLPEGRNGNGGFSLRKIQKFIDVCRKVNFPTYRTSLLEDRVFTESLAKYFNLAPIEVCREFSFQDSPEACFKKNGNKLPMGCHKFEFGRWRSGFWKKYIQIDGTEEKSQNPIDNETFMNAMGYHVNHQNQYKYTHRVVRKFR